MENNITPIYGEQELFSYLQWLRLSTAKRLNDEMMESNKKVEGETLKNLFKSFKSSVNKLDNKNTVTDADLKRYNNNSSRFTDEKGAKEALDTIFKNDENGLTKLLFVVKVILDRDYDYQYYQDEGLAEASKFLYGNQYKLISIKSELEANFKEIAKKPLSKVQKGVIAGVVVASIAASIIIPMLGAKALGASAAGISASLKVAGFGAMGAGAVGLTMASLLTAGAMIGGTYAAMTIANKEAIKKEFKKSNPEETNLYLAIQCLVIRHLKATLKADEFKEHLDQILQSLNSLKGDLDYYLFVEREDTNANSQKLSGFHGFDRRLITVLNIQK